MTETRLSSPASEPKPSKSEKIRAKKEARRVRMRERAGRAEGERASPRQLVKEYWRAGVLRVGKSSRKRINRILSRDSLVGDPPVFDGAQFPFVKTLEDNWDVIRAEADAVLQARAQLPALSELSPDHNRLNNDGRWKAFILYGYGLRSELGCRRCPQTAKLLESIPNLWSGFFSILEPGAHLVPHRGPTKAIITWHLAIVVPEPRDDCWIKVSGERYLWKEGKSFVFDDASKHEVLNDTDQERVVLLMHFRRPLKWPGSWLGRFFLGAIRKSPFIRDARKNMAHWERGFEEAVSNSPQKPVSSLEA